MHRLLSLALCLVCGLAAAQEPYPTKPIRVLVGYTAGGGNDLIVRILAPHLSENLGQPVVVENKPGAQGIIACVDAAKAAPDGYTILMGPSGPMTMNPATYSRLPYSPTEDFAPVTMIASFPLFLVVSSKLQVRSVRELIAYAKDHPDTVSYASSAAPFQIAAELFKQKTGTAFLHVPYKGSGESVQAVASGQVTMTLSDSSPVMGAVRGGMVRALAVTSPHRHPALPNVPTLGEDGLKDMDITLWTGFFVPAKTPEYVITRLQVEVARVLQLADVRAGFEKLGIEPVGSTPEELGATLRRDIERWTAVAKAAGIKND